MKRAVLLILCVALAMLCACKKTEVPEITEEPSKEQPSSSSQPETKPEEKKSGFTVSLNNQEQTIPSDSGEALVQLKLQTPALSANGEDIKATPQAAELISNYYEDKRSDAQLYCEQSLKEYASQQKEEQGNDFTPLSLSVSCEVTRNDGVLFSTLREYKEISGEESSITYKTENFLADTGAILTLEDVFRVDKTQYEKLISKRVLEQIKEKMAQDSTLQYNEGYENNLMQWYNATDFYFDDNGLTLIWQANTLGSGSVGAQFFTLSYDELTTVLNERWLK